MNLFRPMYRVASARGGGGSISGNTRVSHVAERAHYELTRSGIKQCHPNPFGLKGGMSTEVKRFQPHLLQRVVLLQELLEADV